MHDKSRKCNSIYDVMECYVMFCKPRIIKLLLASAFLQFCERSHYVHVHGAQSDERTRIFQEIAPTLWAFLGMDTALLLQLAQQEWRFPDN